LFNQMNLKNPQAVCLRVFFKCLIFKKIRFVLKKTLLSLRVFTKRLDIAQ